MKRKLTTNSRVIRDIFAQYKDTFAALCELINNAIQAGATTICLDIDYAKTTELSTTLIKSLTLKDDGAGVCLSNIDSKLLNIGTKVKKDGKGIGRFASLQLGAKVEIDTIGYDANTKKYTHSIIPLNESYFDSKKNIAAIEIETIDKELVGDNHKTYYKISITAFYDKVITEKFPKRKIVDKLLLPKLIDSIFETYPSQIFDKKLTFLVNGEPINRNNYVKGEPEKITQVYIDRKGKQHQVTFTYFQLKPEFEIKVFLTVKNAGLSTIADTFKYNGERLSPTIGSYFIYVDTPSFYMDINRDFFPRMDESLKHFKDFVRESLDGYFKEKNQAFNNFTIALEKDQYYPYKTKLPVSQTEKLVFDKIAYLVEDKHQLLLKDNELREMIYALIERSIEGGDLRKVIKNVLKLENTIVEKFSKLLEKSDLENIILFSSQIAQKLEDLAFLEKLVYSDISKFVYERKQLHKVLEKMLWIFGEQYNEATTLLSDKNLVNNLNKFRTQLMTYQEDKKVDNIQLITHKEVKLITDLFMFSERIIDEEKREVLIVELKAPRVKLSPKEAQQARDYAFAIEENGVFSDKIQYKIILVGAKINKRLKHDIKGQRKQKPNSPYYYWSNDEENIEIWIMEWGEIFEAMKRKLNYMSSRLEIKDMSIADKIKQDFEDIDFDNVKSSLKKVKGKL